MRFWVHWLAQQSYVETQDVLLMLALGLIAWGVAGLFDARVASLTVGVIVLVYAWPPRPASADSVTERTDR
jgi:uncharacterized membrane protein